LRRAVVSTYQSVSGKGFKGVRELRSQQEGSEKTSVFPQRIADNLIPFIDEIGEDGYCLEETKLIRETRKILGDESLRITATAVRVPIPHCHSESVNLEFDGEVSLNQLEETLRSSPGLEYCGNSRIPSPADVVGGDAIWVGRLRRDPSQPNTLNLWIVGDNLRKGAALNAVQIAEEIP
jgi:aspartate-semialdehyde dehydrogenase